MHSVHFEPDQEPTAEQWAEFDKLVAEHPTKLMLWEAAPLASTAKALEERGIEVIVFSQMGNQPGSGNLFDGFRDSLVNLESAAIKAKRDAAKDAKQGDDQSESLTVPEAEQDAEKQDESTDKEDGQL